MLFSAEVSILWPQTKERHGIFNSSITLSYNLNSSSVDHESLTWVKLRVELSYTRL